MKGIGLNPRVSGTDALVWYHAGERNLIGWRSLITERVFPRLCWAHEPSASARFHEQVLQGSKTFDAQGVSNRNQKPGLMVDVVDAIPKRCRILGVPVDCVTEAEALAVCEAMLYGRRPSGAIIAVNPEKVMTARKNPALLAELEKAALLIPDGIGMVLAARLHGIPLRERVPGADLMPRLCELAARKGAPVFLYGAKPDVIADTANALVHRFPGLRVAGTQHGYVREEEMPAFVERIASSGAQLLFVALGSPRQERWIGSHLPRLDAIRICQGVGGTFDVLAGRIRRAPRVFRKIGLEWFWRLLRQPQRLPRDIERFRFGFRVLLDWPAARFRGESRNAR